MSSIVKLSSAPAVPTGVQVNVTSAWLALDATALDTAVNRCADVVRFDPIALIGVVAPAYEPPENLTGAPVPTFNETFNVPLAGDQLAPAFAEKLRATIWPAIIATSSLSSGKPNVMAVVPVWALLRWTLAATLEP